jgi:drug/metabolite transporter (DMT)-like permease
MVQESNDDSVGKAILWLLLGVAGGLGLDLCAKALLVDYSLEQFVFLRSVVGLLIFTLVARQFGGIQSLITARWRWHLLRAVFATGAMFGFFFGLSQMPLVNALTLGFTAPLIVTALAVPFLGDRVGWRRWTAVLVGFGGVLLILRPGAGLLAPASVAVLIAAVCYASLAITARHLGDTESSFALSIYAIAGPGLISGLLSLDGDWTMPDKMGWLLFLLAGSCSVVAWIGIVNGYRLASPTVLAPFEYTALIGGAVAGYLIWDELPDRWVIAGAVVIIGSGLFVVYREIGNTTGGRYLRAIAASATAIVRRRRNDRGSIE